MPEQFGQTTHHVLHKTESHKLHQSFFVAHDADHDVRIGMPVKLSAAADFTVEPLEADDHNKLAIGIAIHDTDIAAYDAGSTPRNSINTTYGDLKVTVMMRSPAIIMGGAVEQTGESPNFVGGAIVPGPVKYLGYVDNTDRFPHPGINTFENCGADDDAMIGWALEDIAVDEVGYIALIH